MTTDRTTTGYSGRQGPLSSAELLWGARDRPSRGPKPKLTIDRIARAAIAIADAEGLDALSMQRVAKELGFSTMSLYRYVPSKEQLLDVMIDIGCGPAPIPAGPCTDWRAEIEDWVRRIWTMYQEHPWVLRVQINGPPVGPNQLSWFEAALRPLSQAGLGGADLVAVATFLLGTTRELARISLDMAQAREQAGVSVTQAGSGFAAVLRDHVDATRYPTLAGLVADELFEPVEAQGDGIDFDLHFGIQRLLDGIESYVDTGRANR
ncbi:TetR/AcrR family transcriptional regulator [Amycolatopsis marina]|nr:TetR/AcrR family transcriptional regulator [Amycolatopsis marina]